MADPIIYTNTLTLETVRLTRVTATLDGSYVDPSADTVQVAFMVSGKPTSGSWLTAQWESDDTVVPQAHYITVLVGPGGTFQPSVGTYYVWVKIVDAPDVPVRRVAQLVVE